MNSLLRSLIAFISILILSSCQTTWRQPFPSTDIVFQGDNFEYEIGFVNADGSSPTRIKIGYRLLGFVFGDYLAKPKWAIDKNYIFSLRQDSYDFNVGIISFWKQGDKLKECRNWGLIKQIEVVDSMTVIISSTDRQVLLVDLEDCDEIEKILDFSSDILMDIEGVSYSPDHTTLLYGKVDHKLNNYQIVSLDISSNQVDTLARGINPSWSPDGSQIAYVQNDGIYLMKKDGTQKRKIVDHEFFDGQDSWRLHEIPQPRWSPDGEWLVYDRCPEINCLIAESAIFKVEISTGNIIKIIQAGINPDWR